MLAYVFVRSSDGPKLLPGIAVAGLVHGGCIQAVAWIPANGVYEIPRGGCHACCFEAIVDVAHEQVLKLTM